jgi:hypothetical protein
MNMKATREILIEASRLAGKSKTWADLSNGLFDPQEGLIARRLPAPSDRAAFRKSDAYEQLHKLVERKMQQTGVLSGSEPTKASIE